MQRSQDFCQVFRLFIRVFSTDFANKLFNYTNANNHVINLELGKKLLYGSIYSLGLVELETLKT